MSKLIRFLKNWTLPVSMISGALAYYICSQLPLTYEVKHDILSVIEVLQPVLLFIMLFVSFVFFIMLCMSCVPCVFIVFDFVVCVLIFG